LTTLVIRRVQARWQDLLRDYAIVVDGVQLASVANGAEARLTLKPGRHTVQIKIDWCSSPLLTVDLEAGASQMLECGPHGSLILGMLYLTLWRSQYIWLRMAAMHIKNTAP
jgi:hypothetical protein